MSLKANEASLEQGRNLRGFEAGEFSAWNSTWFPWCNIPPNWLVIWGVKNVMQKYFGEYVIFANILIGGN